MKRKILLTTAIELLLITVIVSCKKEPLNGIILDNSFNVLLGETATLTVTYIPENATNKKVSWESSDTNIATVENGKVTGIEIGIAKITATSQDGGRTATCIVYVIQPIEPEMVWVEGGTFTMGCTEEQGDDCRDNELPAHQVTVSGFYIGKYEVTQKEWVAAMGSNPSFSMFTGENKPVHCMSFNDMQEYITILNTYSGKNYRLPTEAEWEFAARGGNQSQGYKYSGSDDVDEVAFYGLYGDHPFLADVGKKKPNELGIYDMSGNMEEICSDWYGNYSASPQINPEGPQTGRYCLERGGGLGTTELRTRVSSRQKGVDHNSPHASGFRLALPAEKKKE